jgi:hypothetical protein
VSAFFIAVPISLCSIRDQESEPTMNASDVANLSECLQPGADAPCYPHHLEPAEQWLDFQLTLQSTSALLTVLSTAARLGCEIHRVHVIDGQARLRLHPPRQVTGHRVAKCLEQVVGVLSISERAV